MKLFTLLIILSANILVLLSVTGSSRISSPASAVKREAGLVAARNFAEKPEISAHAYLIKFIDGERPILKQREWKRLAPASLSKLLTAVVAEEYLPEGDRLTFSSAAKTVKESDEKISSVEVGETFTKEDMLKLLLISSANDAALSIEEKLKGREIFLRLANKKLGFLGLRNSQFRNPTGLDEEGHYTTAEDLAKLAEYIWNLHPEIWEITRIAETVIISESRHEYKIKSTNQLLKEFPGILGGKTGFTDNAKESLILLYPVRSDKVAIIVILGSNERFRDARKIIQWLEIYGDRV